MTQLQFFGTLHMGLAEHMTLVVTREQNLKRCVFPSIDH